MTVVVLIYFLEIREYYILPAGRNLDMPECRNLIFSSARHNGLRRTQNETYHPAKKKSSDCHRCFFRHREHNDEQGLAWHTAGGHVLLTQYISTSVLNSTIPSSRLGTRSILPTDQHEPDTIWRGTGFASVPTRSPHLQNESGTYHLNFIDFSDSARSVGSAVK